MYRKTPMEVSAEQSNGVLRLKEIEGRDGGQPRTIAFSDFHINPLSYDELASATLHQPITIPLEVRDGRIVSADIVDIDLGKYANFSTSLESHFTARAIGLVRGGWLPSGIASMRKDAIIMPDRNIISEVVGRFRANRPSRREADFIDLFSNSAIRINPLLVVVEGNERTFPTPEMVGAQLQEASEKLRMALPKAEVMVGPDSVKGIIGLVRDLRPGFARKRSMLRELAPMLSSPVARRDIDSRWQTVLDSADTHQVARDSLLVLALLSALVGDRSSNPAKKILKFHRTYGDKDAYNALSDFNSLDILISCLAIFPQLDSQICTLDRNLALFWTGAGVGAIEKLEGSARFCLTPHHAMLPDPYATRWLSDIRRA